ncbi:MAG: hypothetical protein GDA43_00420 [Hormoscilla sp. SP5CHS1]|nr:hypothetical protein [Hormoscilla sp. SP12CHS1]MBC6451835.1 hypothetical protein [Hormoscilla sp. SP5CHS1]
MMSRRVGTTNISTISDYIKTIEYLYLVYDSVLSKAHTEYRQKSVVLVLRTSRSTAMSLPGRGGRGRCLLPNAYSVVAIATCLTALTDNLRQIFDHLYYYRSPLVFNRKKCFFILTVVKQQKITPSS